MNVSERFRIISNIMFSIVDFFKNKSLVGLSKLKNSSKSRLRCCIRSCLNVTRELLELGYQRTNPF